ncbi:MAG TPA: glycosyltransferase family 39 protein [Aggregatilineaceae bacterium]|nr:glycosyltransferase family 39 protein [Aggregatilineaceae bacterium]
MHKIKGYPLAFSCIVVAYLVYASIFIYKTSALVEQKPEGYNGPEKYWVTTDQRYFVLFDDAMVSMRFARNLANGDGLVWNPGGERIEGYTNPLWVGYMAVVHLVEDDMTRTSLYIQVTAAILLAINLWVVWNIAKLVIGNQAAALGAVIFTAFYLPLNTWSLQGNEVSSLTLILSLTVWGALSALNAERFSAWPYILLGFSTLIRMDMAVAVGMLAAFLFFVDRAHWKQHIMVPVVSLAAFMIPQTAFRVWYYDAWLPNTYYLKMQGYPFVLRILHGLDVTLRVFIKVGVLPLLVFVFRRDRLVRLLAWMVLGQVGYSIYVGGDAWEWYGGANRYVSIVMPLFFVLLWCTLHEIYRVVPLESKPMARYGIAAFGAFVLVTVNATYGPGALNEWLLLKPSMDAADNGKKVEQALWLQRYTTEEARIALAGAGIVPYFAERPYIDLLGKSDKVIAHRQMDRSTIPELKPGHMKWDYGYSIGELQPDVVMELWVDEASAGEYLNAAYMGVWSEPHQHLVWMKRGSNTVAWALLGLPDGG